MIVPRQPTGQHLQLMVGQLLIKRRHRIGATLAVVGNLFVCRIADETVDPRRRSVASQVGCVAPFTEDRVSADGVQGVAVDASAVEGRRLGELRCLENFTAMNDCRIISRQRVTASGLCVKKLDKMSNGLGVLFGGKHFLIAAGPARHVAIQDALTFATFEIANGREVTGEIGEDRTNPVSAAKLGKRRCQRRMIELDPGRLMTVRTILIENAWSLRQWVVAQQRASAFRWNPFGFGKKNHALGVCMGSLYCRTEIRSFRRVVVFVDGKARHPSGPEHQQAKQHDIQGVAATNLCDQGHHDNEQHDRARYVNRRACLADRRRHRFDLEEAEQEQVVPFGPRGRVVVGRIGGTRSVPAPLKMASVKTAAKTARHATESFRI